MDTGLVIVPQKERRILRWLTAVIIVGLLAISSWYAYSWYTNGTPLPLPIPIARADPAVDESDVAQSAIDQYTVPATNPRYISIPSLNVGNTRVYPVGVTAQNILDTPRNISDAAWYKKSMTPGSGYGAVLIDAHNGGNTKDGVFAKLDTLKPGDKITVERGDGKQFSYSVVENQIMNLDEVNKTGMKMMMQSAETDKEGLNLITCAGKWVPRLGQFDQRVMLRAVRIDS
jgi:LPXTG-site transpeptidase (sortase) family protein